MPADRAWQHIDALDDPVLSGLIHRKLAEVRTAARDLIPYLTEGDFMRLHVARMPQPGLRRTCRPSSFLLRCISCLNFLYMR